MFQTCSEGPPSIICPPLVKYSSATQAKAAAELEEVKKLYPTITQFIADYGRQRASIRVCQKGGVS